MSRYFFDLYNNIVTIDDQGVELQGIDAIKDQVRDVLPGLMRDLEDGQNAVQFRCDVRNETGNIIVVGTILMVIESLGDKRIKIASS